MEQETPITAMCGHFEMVAVGIKMNADHIKKLIEEGTLITEIWTQCHRTLATAKMVLQLKEEPDNKTLLQAIMACM